MGKRFHSQKAVWARELSSVMRTCIRCSGSMKNISSVLERKSSPWKTSISVLFLWVLPVLPILEYSLLHGALLDSHKTISSSFSEPKSTVFNPLLVIYFMLRWFNFVYYAPYNPLSVPSTCLVSDRYSESQCCADAMETDSWEPRGCTEVWGMSEMGQRFPNRGMEEQVLSQKLH